MHIQHKQLAGERCRILCFSKCAARGDQEPGASLKMLQRYKMKCRQAACHSPKSPAGVARTADGVAVGRGRADVLSMRCPAAAAADLFALHVIVLAIQADRLTQAAALTAYLHSVGSCKT